jgi:hypothetical protein
MQDPEIADVSTFHRRCRHASDLNGRLPDLFVRQKVRIMNCVTTLDDAHLFVSPSARF